MSNPAVSKQAATRILTMCAVRNVPESDLLGKIGLSPSAWKRLKYGSQSLSLYNLVLICRALDVSADYLLCLSDKYDRV